MKLPISWLREWVEVEADAAQIADALTRRGFYVEGIESRGHRYPGVVVARVVEVGRHPNADRLSLCTVDPGAAGPVRVVCGAANVHPGMIAPLATVGAKLPGGAVIKRSKIRGEESEGMLCSARELELSDDHEGIVDLERLLGDRNGLEVGRPLDELLDSPDQILEIEIPFNRPDGLSVVGMTREVKAAFKGRWTRAGEQRLASRWRAHKNDFPVTLEDRGGCALYLAQVVDNVTIGPSPRSVAARLEAIGQRAINNVVDITNLVLFEFGQPLHAFDLATLHGPEIRVRRARAGERMTTLDGKERALDTEVLLICDRDRPIAVAGVMGGAETEVSDRTRSLLLECAWFEARRIRRSARALGLATEASRRFERGVDASMAEASMGRFLDLLLELSPDSRPGAARREGSKSEEPRELSVRLSRVRRLAGLDLDLEQAKDCLKALAFHPSPEKKTESIRVRVPPFRTDVGLEEDLVEEIARAWGYDRIPEAPPGSEGLGAKRSRREQTIERARRAMLARGLTEAWCTTLVSEREARETAALLGATDADLVRLSNPMSRESEVLRPNLVAGLLRACAHNLHQGVDAVRLFEIGASFRRADHKLPEENWTLAAIVAGPRLAHGHDALQGPIDFGDAKGLWEAWLEEMTVDRPEWRSYSAGGWKPGASAEVASTTSRIGWAGTLGQQLLRNWDIEVAVHLFVALLDPMISAEPAAPRITLPARFPPVRRDLAFFVPERVTFRELESVLREAAGEWLVSIELFDVYTGPGTPEGMKSLAFALQFQHPERTLAESEVQTIQDRMTAAVAKQCGGRLRER